MEKEYNKFIYIHTSCRRSACSISMTEAYLEEVDDTCCGVEAVDDIDG